MPLKKYRNAIKNKACVHTLFYCWQQQRLDRICIVIKKDTYCNNLFPCISPQSVESVINWYPVLSIEMTVHKYNYGISCKKKTVLLICMFFNQFLNIAL